ncbi:class I SAM-dependent methyltransferase [Alphaproteobacteria bacterium]|nr:class I SAM-dependent methyltransferase [Alphaproteobacteria bacterium]
MICRHCQHSGAREFIDLGLAPPSNSYVTYENAWVPTTFLPLKTFVCTNCWLVQTQDFSDAADLFATNYAYLSSTSKSWLEHAKEFSHMIIEEENLDENSTVIEIAANDGYLLTNFVAKKIPSIGIEPTKIAADIARKKNITIVEEFFSNNLSSKIVKEFGKADLIVANNVLAHVPDINSFTLGLKNLLKPNGCISIEFQHLLTLIKYCQFDTIYHEHYSYLSLTTVKHIFQSFGLQIYNVEKLSTHGGSLRVYASHETSERKVTQSVYKTLAEEESFGILSTEKYQEFRERVIAIKNDFLNFLIECKQKELKVAAYGAAAKGNTLLNFAGVKSDLISVVFDAAKTKSGMLMPGSLIPIESPEKITAYDPDIMVILPWNIADEIQETLSTYCKAKMKTVTVIPKLTIF